MVHGCTIRFFGLISFFSVIKIGVFTFFVEINMLFVWRGIVAFRVVGAYFSLLVGVFVLSLFFSDYSKVNFTACHSFILACAPHDFSLAVREKSALWLLLVKADNLWRTCRTADRSHQFSREN